MNPSLRSTIANLPHQPGVYLFSNGAGEIIYVGKSRNLKSRVSSYFHKTADLSPAKREMVRAITALTSIVTPTEADALILEATQIKRQLPRYNIILKDDRDFLSVRVNLHEPYPSVEFIRRPKAKRGTRLFGPYTSAHTIRQSLKLLKKILPYRTCGQGPTDPCFDASLGRCAGHDLGPQSPGEYHKILSGVMAFLEGRTDQVIAEAEQRMREASGRRQFELAAKIRDQLASLKRITNQQVVIGPTHEHHDVIGLHRAGTWTAVSVLRIRGGRIIDVRTFRLTARADEASTDIMSAFLDQYYGETEDRPKEILVGLPPSEPPAALPSASIRVARRGRGRKLVTMADENARFFLERKKQEALTSEQRGRRAMEDLMRRLHLPKLPQRIEGYDISNIQGTNAVGSMVVFEKGLPAKDHYRKFTIKTVRGSDDFAMLAEVLTRRLKNRDWALPDLFVLDGGKGQLSAVKTIFDQRRVKKPVIALAKREEEIFRPGWKESLKLPANAEALLLLERMRDEAHRFAIGFYRGKHRRATLTSELDRVPGIGPKLKKLLLLTFGSVRGIRQAPDERLVQLVGQHRAELLREHL